jgi:hypothetical protein
LKPSTDVRRKTASDGVARSPYRATGHVIRGGGPELLSFVPKVALTYAQDIIVFQGKVL